MYVHSSNTENCSQHQMATGYTSSGTAAANVPRIRLQARIEQEEDSWITWDAGARREGGEQRRSA